MKRLSMIFLVLTLMISCTRERETSDISRSSIIPKPVSVTSAGGYFDLRKESGIFFVGNAEVEKIAAYLAGKLNEETGLDIKSQAGSHGDKKGNILISLAADEELGDEGYQLEVTNDEIKLSANKPAGLFMGVQTLRQMLPLKNDSARLARGDWGIPTGKIRDYPSYPFRSSMLDVSRHFFAVEDVKRYIDLIAFYKMNHFHLHLSDDQGWRIEIKSWPNLTTHGGTTQVGGGKGGFYTQEEYKDIVRYAADRYITIIPEIDMPGHTNAALASYPELNCNGKAPALYTGIEVGFSTLCARKEVTFKFMDDVVRELSEMTPGPYIHLGGDESHATKKEDYILIVERAQRIVEKYGKKMIGWEEIAQTKLQPNTVVQYWSNAAHAITAVEKGAKIIMSPATKVYLDMKYDSTTRIGLDWAARIEIDSSYNWNLSTRVKGIPRESILGVEAPLWTETVTTMDEIEYLVFPRLPGIAELGWSPDNARSWEEYKVRLANHAPRMRAMDINFYDSRQISWAK